MCLTEEGHVMIIGGTSGHEPRLVEKLIGIKTTYIACGEQHYVALDDNGDLYSWGGMQAS
jgi:alpha-tubulin suppressor-like RCC1 family protein